VTRTPVSRSKGHQAALLTAVVAHEAAAAVGVETCWPWETATTLPSAQGASAPTGGGEGWRHIVAAARLQLVNSTNEDLQMAEDMKIKIRTRTNISGYVHACRSDLQ